MAKSKIETVYYDLIAPAILFHPSLFTPRHFGQKGRDAPQNAQGTPKYSAALGIKKGSKDAEAIFDVANTLVGKEWPGRDPNECRPPLQSGEELADNAQAAIRRARARGQDEPKDCEYFRGFWVMRARSQFPPNLAGVVNGKAVDFKREDANAMRQAQALFFFGAEVGAQVALRPYLGIGANPDGVNAYLQMVFATGRGTKIGGETGPSCAERFSGFVGKYTDENPLPKSNAAGNWAASARRSMADAALDEEIPF